MISLTPIQWNPAAMVYVQANCQTVGKSMFGLATVVQTGVPQLTLQREINTISSATETRKK